MKEWSDGTVDALMGWLPPIYGLMMGVFLALALPADSTLVVPLAMGGAVPMTGSTPHSCVPRSVWRGRCHRAVHH